MKLFRKGKNVEFTNFDVGTSNSKGSSNNKNKTNKIKIAVISSSLVILLALVSFILYSKLTPKRTINYNACSEGISTEASPYLDPSKSRASSDVDQIKGQKLKSIADKILKIENFKDDPECSRILTIYYINISDPENARTYFDILLKNSEATNETEVLRTNVEFLEKQAENASSFTPLGEN